MYKESPWFYAFVKSTVCKALLLPIRETTWGAVKATLHCRFFSLNIVSAQKDGETRSLSKQHKKSNTVETIHDPTL